MATETVVFPEAVVGDRRTCSATANGAIVALIAALPGLVDAAVVEAPVRSDASDNFDRWIRDGVVGDEIIAAYGDPADEPDFWRDRSRRTFFDRVTEPVLIRHGTADDTCPLEWSQATLDALQSAGVDADPDRVRG
jgi:dipeptidyl aminopeptidase/acylaminoacyl peptidase